MTKEPPSAAQVARQERMKTAALEGAKARAEVDAKGVAIRKNMERLRALRLAREAEEGTQPAEPADAKKSKRRKPT